MTRGSDWRGFLTAAALLVLTACGGGGDGPAGVCGTDITSTPRTCVSVEPSTVPLGGTITVTVGLSDLEGDLVELCLAVGEVGEVPEVVCGPVTPAGQTINDMVSVTVEMVDDLGDPFPPGLYRIAVTWTDLAGHVSNTATADFTILPL